MDNLQIRVEKNEKEIQDLKYEVIAIKKNDELTNYKFNQIMTTLEKLDKKIDELNEIPKTRWESVIKGIINTVVTALATAIVGYFIIKR